MRQFIKLIIITAAMGGLAACANAETADEKTAAEVPEAATGMTAAKMEKLVKSFDAESQTRGNLIAFTIADRNLAIVYDEDNDRMRALTPIAPASLLNEEILMRMAQANYDSVLDARYAVADGMIWAAFIHPLASLKEEDLLSALAQIVTAAETFGTTFASGAMIFGGGDSSELHDELLKKLEEAVKKKEAI